jgi:hypothetical protein
MILSFLGQRVNSVFSEISTGLGGNFSAVAVSMEFYGDLSSHDYASARLLLSPQLRSQYSEDDLRTQWEALEDAEGDTAPLFPTSDSTSDTHATVTQQLISSSGNTFDVEIEVERSGDTWTIVDAPDGLIPEP